MALSKSLFAAQADVKAKKTLPWKAYQKKIVKNLEGAGLVVDYVEAVDADTLKPVKTLAKGTAILLAVYCGKTRLIDNAVM